MAPSQNSAKSYFTKILCNSCIAPWGVGGKKNRRKSFATLQI
jgi:hypothetical protein